MVSEAHGFYYGFGAVLLGFPKDFHGEGFWESSYSSQKPPVAPETSRKPLGHKVEGPQAESLTW